MRPLAVRAGQPAGLLSEGFVTPTRCFLPPRPRLQLSSQGWGEGTVALSSNSETRRRASWRCPGSRREGLGSSVVLAALSSPGRGPDPWTLSSKLWSPCDLPTTTWPLSCPAPLCRASAGPCLSPNAQGFQQLSRPSSLESRSLPKGEREPAHPHLQGGLIKMNEANIYLENSAVELFRDRRGDPRF